MGAPVTGIAQSPGFYGRRVVQIPQLAFGDHGEFLAVESALDLIVGHHLGAALMLVAYRDQVQAHFGANGRRNLPDRQGLGGFAEGWGQILGFGFAQISGDDAIDLGRFGGEIVTAIELGTQRFERGLGGGHLGRGGVLGQGDSGLF